MASSRTASRKGSRRCGGPTAIKTREPPPGGSTRKEKDSRACQSTDHACRHPGRLRRAGAGAPARRDPRAAGRRRRRPGPDAGHQRQHPGLGHRHRSAVHRPPGLRAAPAETPGPRQRRRWRGGRPSAGGSPTWCPATKCSGPPGPRAGAFAQYVVAPAAQLVRKPAGLTFTDAAASVMTGLAALVAMRDVAQVGAGTRVLINGASGGVGTMAVQIAKALGAEVTGVCGTARNIELVRSLGADHVIDYTKEDFTQSRQRFDVILDNVLNHPPKATARVLAPNGMLIPNSIGYTGGLLAGLPRMARAVLMGLGSTTVKLVIPCREPREPGCAPQAPRIRRGQGGHRQDLPARPDGETPSRTCWSTTPAARSPSRRSERHGVLANRGVATGYQMMPGSMRESGSANRRERRPPNEGRNDLGDRNRRDVTTIACSHNTIVTFHDSWPLLPPMARHSGAKFHPSW